MHTKPTQIVSLNKGVESIARIESERTRLTPPNKETDPWVSVFSPASPPLTQSSSLHHRVNNLGKMEGALTFADGYA